MTSPLSLTRPFSLSLFSFSPLFLLFIFFVFFSCGYARPPSLSVNVSVSLSDTAVQMRGKEDGGRKKKEGCPSLSFHTPPNSKTHLDGPFLPHEKNKRKHALSLSLRNEKVKKQQQQKEEEAAGSKERKQVSPFQSTTHQQLCTLYFFLAAALVTLPEPSFFSTALMTPTATVWRMSRTAKRPSGG